MIQLLNQGDDLVLRKRKKKKNTNCSAVVAESHLSQPIPFRVSRPTSLEDFGLAASKCPPVAWQLPWLLEARLAPAVPFNENPIKIIARIVPKASILLDCSSFSCKISVFRQQLELRSESEAILIFQQLLVARRVHILCCPFMFTCTTGRLQLPFHAKL